MSDSQETQKEAVQQVVEDSSAPEVKDTAVSEAVITPAPAVAPAGRKSGVAWLALILTLGLGTGGGWFYLQFQAKEQRLNSRLLVLEQVAQVKQGGLDTLDKGMQSRLQAATEQLTAKDASIAQTLEGQQRALADLEAQLQEQRVELTRFNATDRKSWLLAEAEYLLRLANQRLIMAGDTVAAQALLSSADNVLRELDDVTLHDTRAAVAADLAALRAMPTLDVEGIYLRLAALTEQADALVIFQLPEAEQRLVQSPAESWQGRLRQGYEAALRKLSNYIVIRRKSSPMESLMDPQWEALVRQNLRMLLEQAQVALLTSNQVLFSESLQRAQHWVAEFFQSDEAAAEALSRDISELMASNIAPARPDISQSLRTLDMAIAQRLQREGGE